jgi:RimJ/RimL family protein N-acetyltransferase
MDPVVYRIETPRLVLRCWSPEDATAAKRAEDESRTHLRPFMPWANEPPQSLHDMIDKLRLFRSWFDTGTDFFFGVFSKPSSSVSMCLGEVGLHPRVGKGGIEIGYWTHVDHVRTGIATEAVGALTRVAFDIHRLRWVEIRTAATNLASQGVATKLGFAHEATLRSRVVLGNGEIDDACIFTILASDYPTSVAQRSAYQAFDAAGALLASDDGADRVALPA